MVIMSNNGGVVEREEVTGVKDLEVFNSKKLTISEGIVKDFEIPYWTKAEMKEKLERMPPNQYHMLFQFLWRTGVRVSEAINVTKADINFEELQIKIRWLKSRKFRTRIIAMHPSLRLPLYTFVGRLNSDDKLFPFTRQYVDLLSKKYGFGHAHKIRHSFSVNFLRQSKTPQALVVLKEILGHTNISTTMRYLRVVPLEQAQAISEIRYD